MASRRRVDVTPAVFLLAKNKGFDDHRNCAGIGKLFADIDKVKIPEVYSVNGDDARSRYNLFLHNVSYQPRDVRVKNQNHGLPFVHVFLHGPGDTFSKGTNQRIRRSLFPMDSQGHGPLAIQDVKALERALHRRFDL